MSICASHLNLSRESGVEVIIWNGMDLVFLGLGAVALLMFLIAWVTK